MISIREEESKKWRTVKIGERKNVKQTQRAKLGGIGEKKTKGRVKMSRTLCHKRGPGECTRRLGGTGPAGGRLGETSVKGHQTQNESTSRCKADPGKCAHRI